MCINPYEESELEGRDCLCERCGEIISTQTYLENDGFCDACLE